MLTQQHPSMRDAKMSLLDRIDAATNRISRGDCSMRIPAEATDPDIVLADCKEAIAAKDAEIERLRRAVEWLWNTAITTVEGGKLLVLCAKTDHRPLRIWVEVPAEFADIISPAAVGQEGRE